MSAYTQIAGCGVTGILQRNLSIGSGTDNIDRNFGFLLFAESLRSAGLSFFCSCVRGDLGGCGGGRTIGYTLGLIQGVFHRNHLLVGVTGVDSGRDESPNSSKGQDSIQRDLKPWVLFTGFGSALYRDSLGLRSLIFTLRA